MESRSQFAREAHRVWASALLPGPEQSLLKAFCHPSKNLRQARPTDLPTLPNVSTNMFCRPLAVHLATAEASTEPGTW